MFRIALAVAVTTALMFGCSDVPHPSPPDAGPDAPGAADSAPPTDAVTPDTTAADAPAGGDVGPSLCPVKGYTPCGGDLLGAWTFISFCPEDQAKADALYEHPYDNLTECQDRTKNFVKAVKTFNGSLSFDKTSVTVKYTGHVDLSYGFTDACLGAVNSSAATPAAACTAMTNPGKLTCTYAASICTCKGTVQAPSEDSNVGYTLNSANSLTLSPGKESATFCRTGDVLILDWVPHPISWRYWILKRQ
jgi:hypothetical protein